MIAAGTAAGQVDQRPGSRIDFVQFLFGNSGLT